MALNYVSLVFTEQDAGNSPSAGSVTIAPTSAVVAAGITVVSAQPVSRVLGSGTVSVSLVATDNTGTTPAAGFWAYQITLPGGQPQLYLLPFSGGATQQFSNLTPVVAQTTYGPAAAVGFTNPMTTLGDLIYENATPAAARLAGSTSATKQFLTQTGTGSASAAPAWGAIAPGDLAATANQQGYAPLSLTPSGAFAWGAPWQFNVMGYGAKGNGKVITDATIAAGSLSTLTSASAGFTSADTGKNIIISQAGGAAITPFAATITFVNSTTVTLSSAASNAVTNVGAIYGTDDTAAIQAAINAATTYAQGANQYAEVIFPPAYYCIAGAAVIGGATLGNSQITLPIIAANTGTKVNLALKGLTRVAAAPEHWLNPNINAPGAVLVCMRTDGTYNATFGPAAMIGGPVNGYGGGGGTYSNMQLIVDGLTVLAPYNSSYGGLMLYGVGQMKIENFSWMPMAVAAGVAGSAWPTLANTGPANNQFISGIITPVTGNNALNEIDDYTCYGSYIAVTGCDHLTIKRMLTIFCGVGLLVNTTTTSKNHAASIVNWCCEATTTPISAFAAATWAGYTLTANAPVNIQALDLETYSTQVVAGDTAALAFIQGVCWFEDLAAPGRYYSVNLQLHPTNLKMLDLTQTYGPVASPQAPPASTVAWFNGYYRDAWITLSATTITALSIDSTAQAISGSPATYSFLLPSGHSYTPTYTGTLTHTVTLL